MEFKTYFLLYLILYRLAVISAGVISITLGYRMFCRGLWPDAKTGKNELTAEIRGMKFFLKNGAPGTFFALFGIVIISAMIIFGTPEYTREILNRPMQEKSAKQDTKSKFEKPPKNVAVEERVKLKGDSFNASDYPRFLEEAKTFERNGQTKDASAMYEEALSVASEAMNNLAWIYVDGYGKLEDAVLLSKMAVKFNPTGSNYWDTYAEILFQKEEYQEAFQAKKRAVELDEKYKNGMEKFEEAVK